MKKQYATLIEYGGKNLMCVSLTKATDKEMQQIFKENNCKIIKRWTEPYNELLFKEETYAKVKSKKTKPKR